MQAGRSWGWLVLVAALAAGCGDGGLAADPDGGATGPEAGPTDADAGADASDVADAGPADDGGGSVCPPGLAGCANGGVLRCNDAGTGFTQEPCGDAQVCSEGACVGCAGDDDCEGEAVCRSGSCQVPELRVVTESLPSVLEGQPYEQELDAEGGGTPRTWSVVDGELPPGVSLSDDGVLSGSSDVVGTWPFVVQVAGDGEQTATASLTLEILQYGLNITTASPLPTATAGESYEQALQAAGGKEPYFWGVKEPDALPQGLSVKQGGVLSGTPAETGSFEFTAKVFDDADPPRVAEKALTLPVEVAPLRIVGDQEIDLFVTKAIVLPLIVSVDGVPVPYDEQLQAEGGQKPYSWSEEPLPGIVQSFIPKAGIPEGVTLSEDGSLTGSVTNPDQAVSVEIPGLGQEISGFFFAARVEDSQSVPASESAIFLLPTAPVGGLGGG